MTDPHPPLPAWSWDVKLGALVPRCPACDGRTIVSGASLTCNIGGFSHYHERLSDVLEATRQALAAS